MKCGVFILLAIVPAASSFARFGGPVISDVSLDLEPFGMAVIEAR